MAAVEQPEPTVELEFLQAMRDFKTMFPDMDSDVIEAVLRANDGSVDASIDELLTMSSVDGMNKLVTKKTERQPPQDAVDREGYWVGGGDPNGIPLRLMRNWQPQMLSPLPSDFLRIRIPRTRVEQRLGLQLMASKRLGARLADIDRRRKTTNDPEMVQMLEDERMALYLQNEEFMRELKADPEFMAALEKESPSDPSISEGGKARSMDDLEAFRERIRNMGKVDVPTKDNLLLAAEPLVADDDDEDEDLTDLDRMRSGNQPDHHHGSHRGESGKFEPF
ncbi:unnamed protein product [Notodromas monacha]|uniref:CUE domain-containing protein n=1 Tax=Notodromas monacha TaxID=399045 RepID=A0A7R9BHC0_9CRUS|nr:unnamed protein product [Notodromas monacha]CAG0914665.1 unnamed protein product [Notodromas monacha]